MAATDNGVSEIDGRWVFPIAGGEVTQVLVDFALGLRIETYEEPKANTLVRINTPFAYETDGTTTKIDPEVTPQLAPLITLHKATVKSGSTSRDGHLSIEFTDGRAVHVAPHHQYEAWEVSGHLFPIEREFRLIALPGASVALF